MDGKQAQINGHEQDAEDRGGIPMMCRIKLAGVGVFPASARTRGCGGVGGSIIELGQMRSASLEVLPGRGSVCSP